MTVRTARFVNLGSHAALEVVTDEGTAYVDVAKPSIVALGFVPVSGPDVTSGRFPTTTGKVPPDFTDGRWRPFEVPNVTDDVVTVELARRWAAGEIAPPAAVAVPPFLEADAARWKLKAGRLVRE